DEDLSKIAAPYPPEVEVVTWIRNRHRLSPKPDRLIGSAASRRDLGHDRSPVRLRIDVIVRSDLASPERQALRLVEPSGLVHGPCKLRHHRAAERSHAPLVPEDREPLPSLVLRPLEIPSQPGCGVG